MKKLLFIPLTLSLLFYALPTKADTGDPVLTSRLAPALRCLLNTSGTVYSINAASKTSSTSNTKRVEVTVTKTGGKAKSEVTISTVSTSAAGTLTTVKKRYTFENGNYTRTKKFKVWKVEGLKINVRIDNKSFSNKFEYTVRVDEIES
jgi:hypothetical protein